MKIQITDELKITKYIEKEPHVVISIQDPSHEFVKLSEQEARQDWLGLKFHDLDDIFIPELYGVQTNAVIFTKVDGLRILNFYNEWKNKVDLLIIHCVAGVSRSPAIGAALLRIDGQLDFDMFKRYRPNMHVYRTMLNTFYDKEGEI